MAEGGVKSTSDSCQACLELTGTTEEPDRLCEDCQL